MAFYEDMATDIAPLIAELGQAMILRRNTPGTFDPITGTAGVATVTDYACSGLTKSYKIQDIDGVKIQSKDKLILLTAPANMPEPNEDDDLVIAGITYSIQDCKPLAPGGVAVIYEVQGRK